MIDEAQWLNRECLEYLRYLHDDPRTTFALLLVGGAGCYEVISREPMLSSRLYTHLRFSSLTPDEVRTVIPVYHPIYKDVPGSLINHINMEWPRGNFREWAKFTDHARRLVRKSGREVVDVEIARNVIARISGDGGRRRPLVRRASRPYRVFSRPRRLRGTPSARVVLDPEDDRAVLRAIELLGDPAAGVAVVCPTPGNPGSAVLYHDVLDAVGRWSHPRWLRHSERTFGIARDSFRHRRVTGLIIVRAHALSPTAWYHLGCLARKVPLRLWLVVHGCQPRPQLLAAMAKAGVPVSVSAPGAAPLTCLPTPGSPDRQFCEKLARQPREK